MKVSELMFYKVKAAWLECVIYEEKLAGTIAIKDALLKEAQAEAGAPEGYTYDVKSGEFKAPA